ncbi:hypothetical protein [Pseudovibrio sp. Ad37]|uniref:hypothetical protein n=1 Tax=Pseudovibrio sp. Ad37 TaxID=989422 RepID=UPI0007AEDAAA|nr:hypothetical protein [Pseudovibrio sp. Ad37]KZL21948.1 hypothetical protein PsAD37_03468 [Pseudovibrio sp. Ad37]
MFEKHVSRKVYRYPSSRAAQFLNVALCLNASGTEQDWELELSNAERIDEFVAFYLEQELDFEIKQALASLIISSFEDADWHCETNAQLWTCFRGLAHSEPHVFGAVVRYWVWLGSRSTCLSGQLNELQVELYAYAIK